MMADASASKNQKGIHTKKDKEYMMPKIAFFSKLKRVTPTLARWTWYSGGDRPIDVEALSVEEGSQGPRAGGDALLVKPNPDLGRCTAPPWLRQMLMPRGEVVAIRIVEDIQGLVEKEDDVRHKQIARTVAKVIRRKGR